MQTIIEGNLQEDIVLYVNGIPVHNCGQFTQVAIQVQLTSNHKMNFYVNRAQAIDFLVQLHVLQFPLPISIVTTKANHVVPKQDFDTWVAAMVNAITK